MYFEFTYVEVRKESASDDVASDCFDTLNTAIKR